MRSIVLLTLGLALLVAVLSACSSSGASNRPGARIDGIDWRAISVGGLVPPPDHAPTMTIAADSIRGSGGCNEYGGKVALDGTRLVATDMQMTLRACLDDSANEVERRFMTILGARPTIGQRDGHLILAGAGGEIELEAGPAVPQTD